MLNDAMYTSPIHDTSSQSVDQPKVHLSEREFQVLDLIASGFTHAQAARRLGISQHTVDTYVKRLRAKLGPGNKAHLVRMAAYVTTAPR